MSSYPKFRQAIDEAFKVAPPAGSRHLRPIERAVWEVLASITDGSDASIDQAASSSDYLLGEKEKTKEGEPESARSRHRIRSD